MAISMEAAKKIVNAVAADARCCKAIEPNPNGVYYNPIGTWALEFTQSAGGVRNLQMIFAGKGPGDEDFDRKICLGIVAQTVTAIHAAMKAQQLPEVRSCSGIHRVRWGIHHESTWVRMADDTEYVFDWHATLRVRDPAISKVSDWMDGNAVNYVFFQGWNGA
jgi:hypothetical protein